MITYVSSCHAPHLLPPMLLASGFEVCRWPEAREGIEDGTLNARKSNYGG